MLDERLRSLYNDALNAARDVLQPIASQGVPGKVNRELVHALAGVLPGPVAADGGALPALDLCVIREALARHCTDAENAFALQGLGGYPIACGGGDAVRERWLAPLARGDAVAAFALTEPEAGSDAAALALAAETDGDAFMLSGIKTYISNAPEADVYTVFARTAPDRTAGITAFAVAGDAAGLRGESLHLAGDHPIGTLHLDGVRVPGTWVLDGVGNGFALAMQTLDRFRPSVGAAAVGMAEAALERAVAHARSRSAFGGTLARLQGITHQLADVATDVAAARLLVHAAAIAHDTGDPATSQASAMAKLFATETASRAVDVAIQVHGARALERGHLLQHLSSVSRGTRIYEGASEVQREIIARRLFR
ncbi:MAG: acyl-CoA dehydrogenase family protein [Candidatus Dormibacteraeota bacterium]|nr:acyl-CoA dehydrogenase family protein [Candidatus Dormibacteraeota bacterium]